MDPNPRGRLDGPPAQMQPPVPPRGDPEAPGREGEGPPRSPQPATTGVNFDFNNPTVVALLYLSSFILGVTAIVGVVLAYVWRGESRSDWEATHYQYLINTFWIGLIGMAISLPLMIVLIGFVMLPAVLVLVIVRSVLSIINAQKRQPMPNPATLLA